MIMGEFAIGQSVLRREDPRLLQGRGRFFDDLKLADQLYAAIVRSPHAHADITGIDTRTALQMPGVHAVLTGADYRADGLGSLPSMAPYKRRGGAPMFLPPRPAIAFDRVMHVGYPVAVVVADALDQARDAAERVVVEYEPRPGVVSACDAFAPEASQLYDGCPNNEAYFYQAGDKAKVDTAFAVAVHVVEQRLIINRVTANPIEPRGVTGVHDAGTGRYTLHCGFQRPWLFRNDIARTTLKISEAELRLITGDVGGSYGLRGSVYPEIILMLWTARRVGRPVKWTQTRNEAHISDDDARDNIVDAALALDSDGKFLAVKIRSFGNLGAFVSFRGAMPPVVNIGTVVGTYTTPALHVEISGMLTNTHCTLPYRGAGRPEASYMIERLIDIAADRMEIDPAELRRRNTIPPQAMPYKTPLTFTYDSGRFEQNLDRTMKLADWTGFAPRRREAASRGMLRGIGISNTIEQAADATYETAEIRFDPLGGLTLVTGSISHGQGLAEREAGLLPVPYFHIVFTVPNQIAQIAYQNKAVIYDLLFKASSETLLTIAADPQHLGARIGILSVLHTWGSALTHHPHVHMIVPGGGFSPDGSRWVSCRPNFFLPVRVLSRLFRRLFLHKLIAAHQAAELQFFGEHAALSDRKAVAAYLAPLRNSECVVYSKRPFGGPEQVLRYLAR